MASLDRIRTDGFRKWYERQLIECHAWLLSWFLALIVLISGLELAGSGAGRRMTGAALILGGLALTLYSWRRYRLLLDVAERLGEQAACPTCNAYGKFSVPASGPFPLPDGGDPVLDDSRGSVWLRARCRKCSGEWVIR